MRTRELTELYGRRFTPFARLACFVALLISGLLMAFSESPSDQLKKQPLTVEQSS